MTQYTADQLALKAHIEAENNAFAARCIAEGAKWYSQTATDLDWWATVGVVDIETYTRFSLIGAISDISKECMGIRQRLDWDSMTTAELESELQSWIDSARRDREFEAQQRLRDAAEAEELAKRNRYQPNLVFADLKKMMEKA